MPETTSDQKCIHTFPGPYGPVYAVVQAYDNEVTAVGVYLPEERDAAFAFAKGIHKFNPKAQTIIHQGETYGGDARTIWMNGELVEEESDQPRLL